MTVDAPFSIVGLDDVDVRTPAMVVLDDAPLTTTTMSPDNRTSPTTGRRFGDVCLSPGALYLGAAIVILGVLAMVLAGRLSFTSSVIVEPSGKSSRFANVSMR